MKLKAFIDELLEDPETRRYYEFKLALHNMAKEAVCQNDDEEA